MKRRTFEDSVCPIARTLDVVGEWWTFLILRNVVIGGPGRFDDLQRTIGISPNVLSARLTTLVDNGVLERRQYSDRPPRYEYVATEKGMDLLPVLVTLAAWGTKWVDGEPEVGRLQHGDHAVAPTLACSVCDAPVDRGHLHPHMPPA